MNYSQTYQKLSLGDCRPQYQLQDCSTLKQIQSDSGLNSSRYYNGTVQQFIPDEQYGLDSNRSKNNKDVFKKMHDLQFRNDIYQIQINQMHRRQINEDMTIKQQLSQLQNEILVLGDKFKTQKSTKKNKVKQRHRIQTSDYDSEMSSNEDSSDSSSNYTTQYIKQQALQYKSMNLQQVDSALRKFQQLNEICTSNTRLQSLFMQYCGSYQSVELEMKNQNYLAIIDNVVNMLIDLLQKFSSIKIDNLKVKEHTPDKSPANYEFETFNKDKKSQPKYEDSLSPAFNSNDEFSEMRLKLSDQYDKLENESKDSQPIKSQFYNKLSEKKFSSQSNQPSSNVTNDFKSNKTSRRTSKINKVDLMPSLKQRKHKKE